GGGDGGGGVGAKVMGSGSCWRFPSPSCFTEMRKRRPNRFSASAQRSSAYLSSTQSAAKGLGVAMMRVSCEKATASVGASQVRYACSGSVAFASSRISDQTSAAVNSMQPLETPASRRRNGAANVGAGCGKVNLETASGGLYRRWLQVRSSTWSCSAEA